MYNIFEGAASAGEEEGGRKASLFPLRRKMFQKIVDIGIKISDVDAMSKAIRNKGIHRYELIAKFMSANNFPMTQSMMFAVYRADIVLRRMIFEELKVFELKLKKTIIDISKSARFDILDFTNGDYYPVPLETKNFERYTKTIKRLENEVRDIKKRLKNKKRDANIEWIVNELSIGNIRYWLQIVNPKYYELIISKGGWNTKNFHFANQIDFEKKLEQLGFLRNQVYHHDLLFPTKIYTNSWNMECLEIVWNIAYFINGQKYLDFITKVVSYINNVKKKSVEGVEYLTASEEEIKFLSDWLNNKLMFT